MSRGPAELAMNVFYKGTGSLWGWPQNSLGPGGIGAVFCGLRWSKRRECEGRFWPGPLMRYIYIRAVSVGRLTEDAAS